MGFKDTKIYVILITFVFSFVFIFMLTFAYLLFRDRIQANNELVRTRAVLNAMKIPYQSPQEIPGLFKTSIKVSETSGQQVFTATIGGSRVFALTVTGKGLWGSITAVVAVNSNASRLVGMDIISQNETPGLGGRIDEQWFKDQFAGEKINDGKIRFVSSSGKINPDHENGEVDSITGASLTSLYIGNIVNNAIAKAKTLIEEGPHE